MPLTPAELHTLTAPMVVGITGHRDLRPQDKPKLQAKVREVLGGLKRRYPSTPIILLSPLAEGADRLAAHVALEMKLRLVVPLPMPQQDYEQDFKSVESVAEFHDLLKKADHVFPVGKTEAYVDEKNHERTDTPRDLQYAAVGRYIARESQILIALWDGTTSGKVGGTSQIVDFQLNGAHPRLRNQFQPPELFPVYHIVTPRLSNTNPQGDPFHLQRRYPDHWKNTREAARYYERIFRNLDDFNYDILNSDASLSAKVDASKHQVLGRIAEVGPSASERLDLERYAVTDALAQQFQSQRQDAGVWLHFLVFAALAFFAVFAHIHGHPPVFLIVSLLLALLTVVVYRNSAHAKLDIKALDYRAIAEGCRVRLYWQLAGIRESVAENYLGKQRTELDWIRNGLRGWELESRMAARADLSPTKERLHTVQEVWATGQKRYFHDSIAKNETRLKKREVAQGIALGLLYVAIVALPLATYWFRRHPPEQIEEPLLMSGLIIAVDVLLAAAALLHHAIQQGAYTLHIKEFHRMENVFERAEKLIQRHLDGDDLDGVRQCLLSLGQEALSENGDWVLLHRERPLELPPP